MSRMSPRTTWFLITLLVLIIGVVFFGWADYRSVESEPEQTFITLPPEPTYEKGDPNFVSPYNKDTSYVSTLMSVWKQHLIPEGMTFTTASSPEVSFANTIDAEDVVRIILPRQHLDADVAKAKVYVILHQNMKDPYLSEIKDYDIFCSSDFTAQTDGTWMAEFMLGYHQDLQGYVDILLTYDNNIEYFTMARVTQKNQYSKLYYQWLTPDKSVSEVYLQYEDTTLTYCYYPDETSTLQEWINSPMNHDGWSIIQSLAVDNNATYYITNNEVTLPLTDKRIIPMQLVNNQLPLTQHAFDTHNPDYLLRWIGHTQVEVEQQFGAPLSINALGKVNKLTYANLVFYVDNEQGVIQMDIKPGTQNVAEKLPSVSLTGEELTRQLRLAVIPYSDYQSTIDATVQYYRYFMQLQASNCTISYVWEGEMQLNPHYTEFTRIILHTGEEYIY